MSVHTTVGAARNVITTVDTLLASAINHNKIAAMDAAGMVNLALRQGLTASGMLSKPASLRSLAEGVGGSDGG